MRKRLLKNFDQLVRENREEIIKDRKAIIQIEKKIDNKYEQRSLQKVD